MLYIYIYIYIYIYYILYNLYIKIAFLNIITKIEFIYNIYITLKN